MSLDIPLLYSFRRCPYAMRARMAIQYSNINVVIREVELRDKPTAMLRASPKATVPVLVLPDDSVIDESLDIMKWALSISDTDGWVTSLDEQQLASSKNIINKNDGEFKRYLDQYKYADRFPYQTMQEARLQGEVFLAELDALLQQSNFLVSDKLSYADVAVFPFIRQFAHVDKNWFDATSYLHLRAWLSRLLESEIFLSVMKKHQAWQEGDPDIYM